MTYHILYNPLAGTNDTAKGRFEATLRDAGHEVTAHDVTTLTDYPSFFAALDPTDPVVICGGDGTLNRFINDTEGMDIQSDVLYVPGGSGNDFLRDVEKTDADVPFSIKPYLQNLPFVEVNGKRLRFLNNVGFGIDGYCCEVGDAEKAAQTAENAKPVNYTAIAIKGLLFHYKPTTATVTVDGVEHTYERVWLAPTMKGRFYGGGMIPTPAQDRMDKDETLSIMLFHGSGKLKTLAIFPSIFKGEHIKHEKVVAVHTGHDIRVVFDAPRTVQIDGETVTGVTEYHAYAAKLAPQPAATQAAEAYV